MKNHIYIVLILLIFSCKKEKDSFSYSVEFINPYPVNNADDIALRGSAIAFEDILLEGLAEYTKEYRVYFDTVYPPENIYRTSESSIFAILLPKLKPAEYYYWQYSVTIPAGEIKSEIYAFYSAFFFGEWLLDTVASKKGMLDYYIAMGFDINRHYWDSWHDWSGRSYSYTIGEFYYVEDTVNVEDVLTEGEDIERIKIHSNQQIQLYGFGINEYIDAEFIYDEVKGSAIIRETNSGLVHFFPVVNIGYIEYYQKVVLIMMKENGVMLIYSRV